MSPPKTLHLQKQPSRFVSFEKKTWTKSQRQMDSPEKIQPAPNPKVELAVLCSKHRKTIHYDYQGKGQPHEPRWIAILTLGDTSYTSGKLSSWTPTKFIPRRVQKKEGCRRGCCKQSPPWLQSKIAISRKKACSHSFCKGKHWSHWKLQRDAEWILPEKILAPPRYHLFILLQTNLLSRVLHRISFY